jgi:hypothetical protein
MSIARNVGYALLGLILGGMIGGGLGLLGGLGYTSLAEVSGFEGKSGYVVAFWTIGGTMLGLVIGVISGAKLARRTA